MAGPVLAFAQREDHGRASREGNHRRIERPGRFRQEEGRHAQDGRSEQSVRPLQILNWKGLRYGT